MPAANLSSIRARPERDLILIYLQVHLGEWVAQRRFSDFCLMSPPAIDRELRRLRLEHGWPIETDRRGNYRLRAERQGEPKGDRKGVSGSLRVRILHRDGSRCQLCGVGANEIAADGTPARMEIDHIIPRSKGGPTVERNLQTLCHVCNHDKQARTFDGEAPGPPVQGVLFPSVVKRRPVKAKVARPVRPDGKRETS